MRPTRPIDRYIENTVVDVLEGVLAWGMTTIMAAGDHFPHILEVRRMLADGEIGRGRGCLRSGRCSPHPVTGQRRPVTASGCAR